jgi:glycosyltransferase involved in cell wall biosynthesis
LSKIKVLQICDHLGWEGSRMHGVKRLFAWMIPRFDHTRFDVSLLSLRKKDVSDDTLESFGFPVHYLSKSKFDPTTLPALLSLLKRLEIDVIQTHGYGATTFGRAAAIVRTMPNVLHEHANLTDTPWFQKIPDKLFDRWTDIAIAVSESTREFCVKARLLSPERVKKVYLGAPLDEFRPATEMEALEARRNLSLPPDAPICGTVTRLHESKGNRYFIEAAAEVSKVRPDVRFVIVGEGPLQPDLEARARELGVADRILFLGFHRDVAACLASFDIAVFPSLWEGTPLTVFEAMAMAKPILSTDVDGLKDVLRHDYNARVVPPRIPSALAGEMIHMLNEPALRRRLGERALASSRAFDIQTFVNKMERLYELLVLRYRSEGRRPRWDYGKDFDFLEAEGVSEEGRAKQPRAAVT